MSNEIPINNWYLSGTGGPYTAPELRQIFLVGDAFGHPRHEDGKKVSTTPIVKVQGKTVHTRSGSIYRLGTIDPGYKAWIDENYPDWDPENPIRTKS